MYTSALWSNKWPTLYIYLSRTSQKTVWFRDKDQVTIQNYQRDALNTRTIYSSNIITLLYMFRVSSTHLQEDIVVHKQHMVPSLSVRVLLSCWYAAIARTAYRCISTRHYDSYREWRYHMLLMYNYVLLKMSTWYSKHVEESNNIWRINNIQCITLVFYMVNSWCTVRETLSETECVYCAVRATSLYVIHYQQV